MIVAFIATGIVAGPEVLGLLRTTDSVDLLAHIAVSVLLFLVGLKLDMHIVRSLGAVALATGLGQVGFTAAVGFAICRALGIDAVTSAYVAVALTFSSTITLSTYMILYSQALYAVAEPFLGFFERQMPHREGDAAPPSHGDFDVVLMDGLHAAGFAGCIAVRSHDGVDADRLETHGADVILSPFADAAVRAGEVICPRAVSP